MWTPMCFNTCVHRCSLSWVTFRIPHVAFYQRPYTNAKLCGPQTTSATNHFRLPSTNRKIRQRTYFPSSSFKSYRSLIFADVAIDWLAIFNVMYTLRQNNILTLCYFEYWADSSLTCVGTSDLFVGVVDLSHVGIYLPHFSAAAPGMGTRRQWPRPRRDRDVGLTSRDETFAGLETWLRRWQWHARLLWSPYVIGWPCYESAKNCHENANVFSTKAQM